MESPILISAVLIALGIAGIIVPALPGLALVWGGVALWAYNVDERSGWVVLGVVTVIALIGTVIKYLIPGRHLREAGVPWRTLALGTLLGIAGFFVVPVVGLPLGFVLGVYLSELLRLGSHAAAWPSTRRALAAAGWSLLIELATALLMAATWGAGLLVTR